ncbi:MAG: hypothetical protein ACR2H3_12750 [Acidimicrobiales bacterium]
MTTPAGSGSGTGGDWPTQVTDTIERVVGQVRDKTTVPLQTVARGVVYGVLIATIGLMALAFVAIAAIRMLEVYLPVGGVWLPYAIVGGLFSLVGAFLLFVKTRPSAKPE